MDSNHTYCPRIISENTELNNAYLTFEAARGGSLKIQTSQSEENRLLLRPTEGDGAALRVETGDATLQHHLGVMGPSGIGPWELQGLSRLRPFGLGCTLHYQPWVLFEDEKVGKDLLKLEDENVADGKWYALPEETDQGRVWTVEWVVPLAWREEVPGPEAVEISIRLLKV
ncbi:hypothetical protein CkaCkLH20_11450 [Colletotrichum karsti]|uniref:Uncharacterized protein n=1 Tax=Colletotrichum karsti TaxID=1095194 RepID=A0A9P6LF20_9PEZI|nr:uncharacterized protein CkaCkLH20_11450 [Colletotrichum karsti]KAF9871033.1 hypothetical protein CkaCkLH20_11450 [Colletotrichum karsti]